MRNNLLLFVETENCTGCHACEVACKQEKDLAVGTKLIKVYQNGPMEIEGKLKLRYNVAYCIHCRQPKCINACQVKAITKRQDGIVLIDEKDCVGCKECLDACPLGVMQFDMENEIVKICDMCVDRIDQGLLPACVDACPAHCMYFGDDVNLKS